MRRPPLIPIGVLLLSMVLLLAAPSRLAAEAPPFTEREIEEQYRRHLQQLAEGTSPAAVAVRLRLLEDICFEHHWEETLWRVQEDVARRLEAACGPDCLLPLLLLQQELVLDLLDTYGLVGDQPNRRASYALTWREKLEDLHRQEDKRPEGARARADLNAAFGVGYRDRSMMENARLRFESALRDDPDMVEALHLLGTLEEKLGLYRAARPPFQHLVETHPEDHIARLRLALLEARMGREAEAMEALSVLLATEVSGEEDWIRRLAYQQLAKLQGGDSRVGGDPAVARQTLLQGLEEFPHDQPLRIALAFYTEDREASRQILEALAADALLVGAAGVAAAAAVESARGRYNNWPSDEVADLLPRLHRRLDAANPALQRALVAIRGPGSLP